MAALRALRTMRDRMGRLPLYEDVTPSTSWTDGPNGRNLIIDVPGFKKEEVNMEIDESGNVTIKGRHDVGNNRFKRFSTTVKAPEDTDMKGIVGILEGALYTVHFPKKDAPEAVQEGKPEQKQLDADELYEQTDKGLEAALDTEAPKTTEKVAVASSTEAAVDKTETAEKDLETAKNKTEITSAGKETILKKELETDIHEAENATKTPGEHEIATKEPETRTKPLETAVDQEPQTVLKPPETAAQELENVTKPAETASPVLETSATASEKAITATDAASASASPETVSLSEMPKAAERSAPKTGTAILQKEMVKHAIKDEKQEHQGTKKDGGILENVMEMINEHKVCIISAILAFSMGILISRRISS